MQAKERLERKIKKLLEEHSDDQIELDRAVGEELSADELLTIALMPTNSRLHNRVTGCLLRDSKRKK
jgi:hypothetical protein